MSKDYACKTTPDTSHQQANSVVSRLKSSQGGTSGDKLTLPKLPSGDGVTSNSKPSPKKGY